LRSPKTPTEWPEDVALQGLQLLLATEELPIGGGEAHLEEPAAPKPFAEEVVQEGRGIGRSLEGARLNEEVATVIRQVAVEALLGVGVRRNHEDEARVDAGVVAEEGLHALDVVRLDRVLGGVEHQDLGRELEVLAEQLRRLGEDDAGRGGQWKLARRGTQAGEAESFLEPGMLDDGVDVGLKRDEVDGLIVEEGAERGEGGVGEESGEAGEVEALASSGGFANTGGKITEIRVRVETGDDEVG
jgi:hypothetical protein